MIVPNEYQGYGGFLSDMKAQDKQAQNKILQPADPEEFIKWIQDVVRQHNEHFQKLREQHSNLEKVADQATIGLTRLSGIVLASDQEQLKYLLSLHRDFVKANEGIGYTLSKCDQSLKETMVNYQLVGETLRSTLADRHKKIAVQKELGLRLSDIDTDFKRCQSAVDGQAKINRQLSQGIQKLMNKTSIKLPPKMRENINREDLVAKIALEHRGALLRGKDKLNYVHYDEKVREKAENQDKMIKEVEKKISKLPNFKKQLHGTEGFGDSISYPGALAALTIGAILGVLILSKLL